MKDIFQKLTGKPEEVTVKVKINKDKIIDEFEKLIKEAEKRIQEDQNDIIEAAKKAEEFEIEKYNKHVALSTICTLITKYCEAHDMDEIRFAKQILEIMKFERDMETELEEEK